MQLFRQHRQRRPRLGRRHSRDTASLHPGRAPLALLLLATSALVASSGCDSGRQLPPDAGIATDCSLDAVIEARPGFPFDPQVFREQVWPALEQACAQAGCHLAPNGVGGFSVWPVSTEPCEFSASFNAVYAKTDFRNDPKNSRVYASVTGANPLHPAIPEDADLDLVLDYVTAAYQAYVDYFGVTDPTLLFDRADYVGIIQPAFDAAGCTISACHAPSTAADGFVLHPFPAADSAEMDENLYNVVKLIDFSTGDDGASRSRIYVRSIDQHRHALLRPTSSEALLDWIRAGLPDGDEPPGPGCADVSGFNLEVFRDDIRPILVGEASVPGEPTNSGCALSVCHGEDRGAGTLYLDEDASAEDNLAQIACFVDLANPSASQLLVCPIKHPDCNIYPHPGEDIFSGVTDLRYQRVLSYLYASTRESTPLDFAFFAQKINPLFNDEDTVGDGQSGLTCADVQSCHGVTTAGQTPPNYSNFAIIREAISEQDLLLNFMSAANFTYFPDPTQSSLFLYPTDEISNLANPWATGLRHPGGQAFAPGDPEAALILRWAGGLRVDEHSQVRNWLVGGDFPANDVVDEMITDEASVQPRVFDTTGGSTRFHRGEWRGYFADQGFIDLNDPAEGFARDVPTQRMVYAVAYIINTDPQPLEITFTVRSPNDVMLYVGEQLDIGRGGTGTALTTSLPSYAATHSLTRVMVKVLQTPEVAEFGFEFELADRRGEKFDATDPRLVFKLGPQGGI
ncbi:hypothetical protein [Haliangium ochraceum]|uniref:Uncharacterized protein n=1 Tax=Haliangium ochraceum (strain DSM 14365 / JCM 11303 / SMP-2) TaxID=502025 RepID=D0LU48_HALO1|nr:hypothetical protein [Haliangium ochraceum]ACY17412.1 hypothetical protein Hoch_4923 [Haliangium ochraceum DSM 14365]